MVSPSIPPHLISKENNLKALPEIWCSLAGFSFPVRNSWKIRSGHFTFCRTGGIFILGGNCSGYFA